MPMPSDPAATVIDLASERIRRVLSLSQTLTHPKARWQSHLALLALEGMVQWICDRATPIQLDSTQARLLEPAGFGSPAAIHSVWMNQFRIGLFIVGDDVETEIEFPTSLLQNPSHFYVAAQVDEEANQVFFHSFLRGDCVHLNATTDVTFPIPVDLWESNLEALLWYVASLEPSVIPLPTSRPALTPQLLIQPLVDAAHWVQAQVQAQIEELTWTLFSPELVAGMRSSRASAFTLDLTSVLTEIERSGIHIPATAQSVYRTIILNQHPFRLYLSTWALEDATASEWSLLTILESMQSPTLPTGTELRIQEGETLLVEEKARAKSAYLIAQTIGTWNEKFTLTLNSLDPENSVLMDSVSLPPITFQPY
jgi:hypothetical protein